MIPLLLLISFSPQPPSSSSSSSSSSHDLHGHCNTVVDAFVTPSSIRIATPSSSMALIKEGENRRKEKALLLPFLHRHSITSSSSSTKISSTTTSSIETAATNLETTSICDDVTPTAAVPAIPTNTFGVSSGSGSSMNGIIATSTVPTLTNGLSKIVEDAMDIMNNNDNNNNNKMAMSNSNNNVRQEEELNGITGIMDVTNVVKDNSTSLTTTDVPIIITNVMNNNTTEMINDTPTLTEAGGYTHTKLSRAKISAGNRGKTPWNKGRKRSEAEKLKISEGVRHRNRIKFLAKIQALNMTEDEFLADKKEKRRIREAERRARRTENGGYHTTEETKAKISKVLKAKYANGEIKKRTNTSSFIRRGFSHSDETKDKIQATLKKKWAEDLDYREMMKTKMKTGKQAEVRSKISATLKEKWKDPVYRARMMENIRVRRSAGGESLELQKSRISDSIRLKWQDDDYRLKCMDAIKKRKVSTAASSGAKKKRKKREPKILTPEEAAADKERRKRVSRKKKIKEMETAINSKGTVTKEARKKVSIVKVTDKDGVVTEKKMVLRKKKKASTKKTVEKMKASSLDKVMVKEKKTKKKVAAKKKKKKNDGDISQLREERRDLFDLLYSDVTEDDEEQEVQSNDKDNDDEKVKLSIHPQSPVSQHFLSSPSFSYSSLSPTIIANDNHLSGVKDTSISNSDSSTSSNDDNSNGAVDVNSRDNAKTLSSSLTSLLPSSLSPELPSLSSTASTLKNNFALTEGVGGGNGGILDMVNNNHADDEFDMEFDEDMMYADLNDFDPYGLEDS